MKLFQRIAVINLTRRTDRREQMNAEFARAWPMAEYEFFAAFENLDQFSVRFDQGRGAWNCGQSHLEVIRQALRDNVESLLIMEDDCTLADGFAEIAANAMADLPADWEIIWFGGEHRQQPFPFKPGLVKNLSTDRLHCYGLSRAGLVKLEAIWAKWDRGHCDWRFNQHLREFKTFAVSPWIAGQRGGPSDINGRNKPTEWFNEIKPPGEGASWKAPFERVFVINLEFHSDRLKRFRESLPSCFSGLEVFPAIFGDRVQVPRWWKAGGGAWGCYRSHLAILERCLSDGVDSYCVFEDDAVFKPDFNQRLQCYCESLDPNWEQAYLGGQLLAEHVHPPEPTGRGTYIPYNVNRTHAFAVHSRGFRKLYDHLTATPFPPNSDGTPSHIDHHFGHLQESRKILCEVPGEWLCGQSAGISSINGRQNPENWWADPQTVARRKSPVTPKPRPLFSACMPTRGRAIQAVNAVKNFYATTAGHQREMIVVSHPDDAVPMLSAMASDQVNYPGLQVHVAECTAIEGWNIAASHARGGLLKVWDDDLIARPGWLDEFFRFYESKGSPELAYIGLLATDRRVPDSLFLRAVGTRRFFSEVVGGVLLPPKYKSWYCDNELFELGKRAGCLHYCEAAKIDHHQAATGGAEVDETALIGQSHHENDRIMFEARQIAGFPQDWQPILQGPQMTPKPIEQVIEERMIQHISVFPCAKRGAMLRVESRGGGCSVMPSPVFACSEFTEASLWQFCTSQTESMCQGCRKRVEPLVTLAPKPVGSPRVVHQPVEHSGRIPSRLKRHRR